MAGVQHVDRESLLGTLVALRQYSMDLTEVARHTLGRGSAANHEIGVLLAINASPGITPSDVALALGIDRAVGTRALRRLVDAGVVRRERDPNDGRTVHLHLTARGRRRIADFERALGGFFRAQSPFVAGLVEALGAGSDYPRSDRAISTLEAAERMAAAGGALTEAMITATSAFGVTAVTDRYALAEIALTANVRPYELASRLRITTGGVTHVLDRLEREGLVERSPADAGDDGRSVRVKVTAKGRRVARIMTSELATHAVDIGAALGATLRQSSTTVRESTQARA